MKIAIMGASGFGREVADIAVACGYKHLVFLSPDGNADEIGEYEVLIDNEETVTKLQGQGFVFAIGIGNPQVRKRIKEKYPQLSYPNLIHPTVTFGVNQEKKLPAAEGNIIAAGCHFSNNIIFGNFGIFNFNTTVAHDCDIGDFVSIMPGTIVSGNVHICDLVYVGARSVIIQGKPEKKLKIGQNSFVGIGSVVIGNIKEGTKVFGNPAKRSL